MALKLIALMPDPTIPEPGLFHRREQQLPDHPVQPATTNQGDIRLTRIPTTTTSSSGSAATRIRICRRRSRFQPTLGGPGAGRTTAAARYSAKPTSLSPHSQRISHGVHAAFSQRLQYAADTNVAQQLGIPGSRSSLPTADAQLYRDRHHRLRLRGFRPSVELRMSFT